MGFGGDTTDGQYVFSSSPTLPREKTPDILVKFKAASSDQSFILNKLFYVCSSSTLVEVRRKIHKTFASCYEKGFIFLDKNKEVLRSRERITRVFDILPKLPSQHLNPAFKFPEVQYKKISYEKDGRRISCTCVGVVFLFEDSGVYQWSPSDLKTALSGSLTDAFAFIPFSVTSMGDKITDTPLDQLNYSASKGNMSVLRNLLQTLSKETDTRHLQDYRLATPLHYAAQSGHVDACELLIGRFGRDLMYMKDLNKRTPLHCALTFNKPDVIVYLLQLGPNLDCYDVNGLTCRHMLVTLSDTSTHVMLSRLDPGLLDDTLLLHFACYTIQLKMIELAKRYCRYVPVFESSFYRPPLHLAAELGHEEIVKILLEETNKRQSSQEIEEDVVDPDEQPMTGHDPEDKDPDGFLPFHYACQHGHATVVSLLYFESMNNDDFVKGIHLAVTWKKYDVLDTLISLRDGFQITAATKEMLIKETELNFLDLANHYLPCLKNDKAVLNRFFQQAAYHGTVHTLKWLLSQGVEIDLGDFMGRTALHNGVQAQQNEVVKVLLEHGADPNVRDWQKSTPLHYSCCLGHVGTCRVLLTCDNITPGLQDSCGRTPIMVAASKRHDKLMDYLINNHLEKMNPKATDSNNRSLLHYIMFLREQTADSLMNKLSTMGTALPVSVQPAIHASAINLYEIWTDWSHIHPDVQCPAVVRPKKKSLTATQMRCVKCGKRWTVIGDTKRWIHVCRVQNKGGELDKLSNEEDAVICQSISRPFQRFSTQESIAIPLLHLLIMHNRSDLIHTVNVYEPELFHKQAKSAAVLAAKLWSLPSLICLNEKRKFTKDELNALLLVALLNDSCDQNKDAKQVDVVKQLIEMGASPNHTPTSLEIFNDFVFSAAEKNLLLYSPLELAVLKENEDIIDVLLRHNASTLTCFAVHFAVWIGNTKLVSTLLTHRRNELQSNAAIDGITGSIDEFKRICSQGVFQAAASSSRVSNELFSVLNSLAPELLQTKTLLTLNMVLEIRPSVNISLSSPVNAFAFSLVHKATFTVLPFTKLIQNRSRKIDLEKVVCQVLDDDVHLGEFRVTKHSSVHCVCEVFVCAVRKRLRKVVDRLLARGGSALWKCLLSEHQSCHKYVYFEYHKKPSSPLMLPHWQEFFKHAPLETLTTFFKLGQTVVNSMDASDIQHISAGDRKADDNEITKSNVLSQVAWFHITQTKYKSPHLNNPGQHLVATKLLYIFPKLFPKYINEVYSSSCKWQSAITRSEIEKIFNSGKQLKTAKTWRILQTSTKEARLMTSLGKLNEADLVYVKTHELSMLQYAAATGDVELAKCCLSALEPLVVACRGKDDVVPLAIAAALADTKMVDVLLDAGHAVGQQSLSAACLGKPFLKLLSSIYNVPSDQLEKRKLDILKKFESRANHSFWQDHRHNGTVLTMAISMSYWTVAELMLDNADHHTKLTYPKELFIKLVSEAPTKLCGVLLERYRTDMVTLARDVGGELFTSISSNRGDDVLERLLTIVGEDVGEVTTCKQLADDFSYTDSHNTTSIHYLCQKGNYDAVSFITAKLGKTGRKSLARILNLTDGAGATPLWYAIAGQHWNIAEHILLNGGGLSTLRSIPDWKAKRKFTVSVKMDEEKSSSLCRVTTAAWTRNASSETAFSFAIHHRPPTFVSRPCAEKRAELVIRQIPARQDKEAESRRQKINYLVSLWKFSECTSSTMCHAAAAVGDVQLMESLLKLPAYERVSGVCEVNSPLLFAVANGQLAAAKFCVEKRLSSKTEPELLDALAMCLFEAYGFTNAKLEIAKQAKKYNLSADIANDLKYISNNITEQSKTLKKTLLSSPLSLLKEADLQDLTRLVFGQTIEYVPDNLLVVFALGGKSWLCELFQQHIQHYATRTEIYSRTITTHLTVLDLMFVFARYNPGEENSDTRERGEILKLFRTDVELTLNADILRIAVEKHLFVMLDIVVQDSLHRGTHYTINSHWETHLLNTGKLGLKFSLTTLIQWMEAAKADDSAAKQGIQLLLETLLSMCCLHSQRELVKYLLERGVSVSTATELPAHKQPRSAIDSAVISGDMEVIDLCIKACGDKWGIPSTNCLYLAAAVKGVEILDKLLKSKRYSRFSTKSFCEELMLISAKHGHENNCLRLISDRSLDVLKKDKDEFTVLHYACRYDMRQLADNIIKSSKDSVKVTDKFGMTPLDTARAMGNTEIALQLREKSHINLQKQTQVDLNLFGWFKLVLTSNALNPTAEQILMPNDIAIIGDFRKMRPKYKQRRVFNKDDAYKLPGTNRPDLTLPSLLGRRDDNGACAMLETAQETVVQLMSKSYSQYPLLHLCAILGCDKSLGMLLELIKKYSGDHISTWTRRSCQRGKIPIVYAIENRQVECVKALFVEDDCLDWLGDNCGETILHHVAKTGSEEICQLITAKATDDHFSVRDKHGCTPAALCVALGHHSIVMEMLRGFQLDGVDHASHDITDFSCIDCLLDRCIGWSRMYTCNTDIPTNMPQRCVMKRDNFSLGYTTDGAGHDTHPLTNILAWSAMSSTTKLVDVVLHTMGYAPTPVAGKVFVLINACRSKDIRLLIHTALNCGFQDAACYLFKENADVQPDIDEELCLLAVARHMNVLVSTIINETDVLTKLQNPSALDVAFGFGNLEAARAIEGKNGLIETDNVSTLTEIANALPLSTRWRLGISQPGDSDWLNSLANQTEGLTDVLPSRTGHTHVMSEADALLSMKPDDHFRQILENLPLTKESILPQTYMGKAIQVDIKSFEAAAQKCDIKGIWLYSIILSKLIMGRYHFEIELESVGWKAIQTVVISCVQDELLESPHMKVLGSELHDRVAIRKTEDSERDGQIVFVETADIPVQLSHEDVQRARIQQTVIPSIEALIKDCLMGKTMNVDVDWSSVDTVKDRHLKQHIIMVLTGEHGGNSLGGLETMILRCGAVLDSISALAGDWTANRAMCLIAVIKTIVVRYVDVLPTEKKTIISSNDNKIIWYFSLKDFTLHYKSSLLAMYKSLQGYCTACYSITDCFLSLENFTDNRQPIEVHIDVRSFEEAGITESFAGFFRTKIAPVMKQIASAYAFMLRLKLDVNKMKLLATESKEKSGIVFKDGAFTVCLLLSKSLSGTWHVDDLNLEKIFTDMEVRQIKETFSNICDDLVKLVKSEADGLKHSFGIPVEVTLNNDDWLEDVARVDARAMTDPGTLLTSYVNTLAYHTLPSYEEEIIKTLTSADCWRLLKNTKLPSGFWCAFNYSALKDMSETRTFLVKTFDKIIYEVLTLAELKKRESISFVGLWYLIPTDRASKYDRIQLLSLRGMLFYIPDCTFASRFASGLKTRINIQPRFLVPKGKKSDQSVYLSFNDIITYQESSFCNLVIQNAARSLSGHIKPSTDVSCKLYSIWIAAKSLGVNISFDLKEFQQNSSLAIVAEVVSMTLEDLLNERGWQGVDRQVNYSFLGAFSNLGTVSVGFQSKTNAVGNNEMGTVEGTSFDEMADITFISQIDLHVNFRSTILVSDKYLQPITETLKSALCKSFQVQAPPTVTQTLSDVVDISLPENSVTVPTFHSRVNNTVILHAVSDCISNFDLAMRYIVKNHQNATNRLKSELQGVVFRDYGSPVSVATFTAGVLECSLFKAGNNVTVEEMQNDIVAALERQCLPSDGSRFKSSMPLLKSVPDDTDSLLTVTCFHKTKKQPPKIERLKRPKATSKRAIENSNEKLFYHVQLGQTGNIQNELDIGANIDHRAENGATPLLRACQLRNYVVQNLLVSRGANLNKYDDLRRTALHYVAAHGDVESLELLLTHGAKVNVQDKNGRTPLHYAVNKSHIEAADLLVFCGADASIPDKTDQSAASRCRHPKLYRLMMESQLTVNGIKNGYIRIEYVTLEANTSYHLPKIGLSMRTPVALGTGSVGMVWRRVQPEYSRTDLAPADKELLMSDVFEYRMSGTDVTEKVVLKIPVYSKVDRFEEVYMKTDREDYLGRLEIREDKKDEWVCYVKVNLSSMKAFVLITLPKKELFAVTSSGGSFSSTVSHVEILVKPNTFEKPGNLTLEILPSPAVEEEEFDDVLSLSHFYDLNHSEGEQPQKEVIVTIPLPVDYFGDGVLYVMLRHEQDDYVDEQDLWEILDRNPIVHDGMVNINMPHFSHCNLLEYRGPFEKDKTTDKQDKVVIEKNAKLLEKAKRRECSVVFVAMLKPLPDSGLEAIIECTRNSHRNKRMQYWVKEGYIDQNPSYTNDFVTFPKQEFKLDIGGNAKKVNPLVTKLQYHPKRQNVLKVPITMKDFQKDNVGWVEIRQKQENLEKEFEENPSYDSLAQIFLHFLQFESQHKGEGRHSESTTEEEKGFEGFTNETLLKDLARDLDRKWQRVAVLLGFSDTSLKKQDDDQELTDEEHRYKLLQSWRDSRLHKRDHGVPELLIALQKSGRKDLVKKVIQTLKEWIGEKTERRDRFYTWLEAALSDKPSSREEILKPMSDMFISQLVKETGVVFDLASELDVSKPELDLIHCNPLERTPESKMVKLFATSRDKHTSDDQAFQMVVEVLTAFSLEEARNWMLRTARQWVNSVEKTDDPFVHRISDYLDEVEPLYLPVAEEEDEEIEEEKKAENEKKENENKEVK